MIQPGGATLAFPAAHLSHWVALKPPSPEPAPLASAATVHVCWAATGTSSLNSAPIFCSALWVACKFPWSQRGLLQTLRCKPGDRMALKTLDLVLEGSVRSWIDAWSAQCPCPSCWLGHTGGWHTGKRQLFLGGFLLFLVTHSILGKWHTRICSPSHLQ